MTFFFFWGLSPCFVDGLFPYVFTWSSFFVCVCVLVSSTYEDISHIGLEFTLMILFELSNPLKDHIYKYSYILSPGARNSTYELLGNTIQSKAPCIPIQFFMCVAFLIGLD